MKALVVYGSKRGGTKGLAQMLGDALTEQGIEVTVRSAAVRTGDVGSYDAVVVGGALYAGRWHKAARRFVKRESDALRDTKVWLFSSGPIGDDAEPAGEMEPVGHVRAAMERVGAVGHATFGGRLEPDAKGFPANAMAKKMAGDWRDPEAVSAWAKEIAASLA
ncbi:flavodoxin [Nocardioides sp. GY 10113]|uniref:flavodoxin domain-containing protein n=1 Tax=Nocardioides sp. GY 10113 TaxID=2569761 RepID=UPI0010A85164|nr:flavodoxin domain-containing protein [Nocardioides sp. GY 10113]TIC88539.1 flavodoxin [Nocardioides sp. GY 10113]